MQRERENTEPITGKIKIQKTATYKHKKHLGSDIFITKYKSETKEHIHSYIFIT